MIRWLQYEAILQEYSDNLSKVIEKYGYGTEKYQKEEDIIDDKYKKDLDALVRGRLDRFEITLDDAVEFFTNVASLTYKDIHNIYPKELIKNEQKVDIYSPILDLIPDEQIIEKNVDEDKLVDLIKQIALEAYNKGTNDISKIIPQEVEPEERIKYANPGLVQTLHMAYLFEMINNLNPKELKLTVPKDVDYTGPLGYNLDFDGLLIIEGNLRRFGKYVRRGNFRVNGHVEEINVQSKGINLEINSFVRKLFVGPVGELVINGDVSASAINPYFDKIVINGNATINNMYMPEIGASKQDLKKEMGKYYDIYTKSKRESITINGDLTINRASNDSLSDKTFYEIINKMNISGKITVAENMEDFYL